MPRRKKSLKILFVADPLANFNPRRETTLFLMKEAARRGHEVYATTPVELGTYGKEVYANCRKLKILGIGKTQWYKNLLEQRREIKSFDAILLRKDPPFDAEYLHHLQLLDLVSNQVYMMNHPRGILIASEKIEPLLFPAIVPETLISADEAELLRFVNAHPAGSILKPIGMSGGRGVYHIAGPKSPNIRVILDSLTAGFRRHIIAQPFLKQVRQGDKRILTLGQKFLGAFLRKPAPGDHRANLHSGGSLHAAKINARDRQIISILQDPLSELGLDFVGLDIIGGYLTEINTTSPMGLAELKDTGTQGAEAHVLDFIERRIQ